MQLVAVQMPYLSPVSSTIVLTPIEKATLIFQQFGTKMPIHASRPFGCCVGFDPLNGDWYPEKLPVKSFDNEEEEQEDDRYFVDVLALL